jgi:hypothetical protein
MARRRRRKTSQAGRGCGMLLANIIMLPFKILGAILKNANPGRRDGRGRKIKGYKY